MSETQTDLIQLGYAPAQQPNTDKIRTWEIAGHLPRRLVLRRRGGEHPRLHHAREQRAPAQRGPGRLHRLRQVGRTTARRRRARRRSRCRARSRRRWRSTRTATSIGGVRTPAVDVPVSTLSGAPPAGANADLLALRVDRRLHPGAARQPLRLAEQLHRPVHEEPEQGDRRRVHPQRRQGLAAGPGGAGAVPRLVALSRRPATTRRPGAT